MKRILIVFLCLASLSGLLAQTGGVSINPTGNAPDPSAMLDIQSGSKGLLLPRMNSSSRLAISNPAKGLLVYDTTTNSLWYFNGSAWDQVRGQSGTIQGTNGNSLNIRAKDAGSFTSGNARGEYSVDLQMSRGNGLEVASGLYSVISGGSRNIASNSYAVVGGGLKNQATEFFTFVGGGRSNRAEGRESAVLGGAINVTIGEAASILGGKDLRAESYMETVVGSYNIRSGGSTDTWVGTEPIFVVGNGQYSTGITSNALTVLKNGKTGIGIAQPTERLDVNGGLRLGSTNSSHAGTIRYSGTDFEGYDGFTWRSLTSSVLEGDYEWMAETLDGSQLDANNITQNGNATGYPFTANGIWQSFTAVQTGVLRKVIIRTHYTSFNPIAVNIYEGEGTQGNLLFTTVPPAAIGDVTLFANEYIPVSSGNKYTIEVKGTSGAWLEKSGNSYPGGRSSTDATVDHFFVTYVSPVSPLSIFTYEANGGRFSLVDSSLNILPNGNVGIGVLNPQSKLHLSGKFRYQDGTQANGRVLTSSGNGTASWQAPVLDNLGTHIATQNITLGTYYLSGDGDNEGIYLAANGHAGIGTASPQNMLDVSGGLAVGTAYAGSKTSPANGAIIEGRVGIGTNNPSRAKLEINGSVNFNPGVIGYLNAAGATGSYNPNAFPYSIYATNVISGQEFHAHSDQRIKHIQGISNSEADLSTLMQIEVTDYRLRDSIAKGNRSIKKVIAQQVAEVYSQAVTTNLTEVVPDIYQRADVQDGWIMLATDLKAGDRVKLITENASEVYEVLEGESTRFKVSALTSDFSPLFVYGREVDDFHTVDYEAISMLNVSATQEQQRIIEAQQQEIESLKKELLMIKSFLSQSGIIQGEK